MSPRKAALVAAVAAIVSGAACADNMVTGTLTPVPPVGKVPPDLDGRVILVADEAVLESKDPVHHRRAAEAHVLRDYRDAMIGALKLTGMKVTTAKGAAHDLEAKLALHVDEDTGRVNQVYRCQLVGGDGSTVARIDWTWPQGTYVESGSVFDFASHHLAEEVAHSRPVIAFLRSAPPAAMSAAADSGTD